MTSLQLFSLQIGIKQSIANKLKLKKMDCTERIDSEEMFDFNKK